MVDVGLAPDRVGLAEAEPAKPWIAEVAHILRRHRVGAEPEEAERASLKDVGDLITATADLGEIVAIAGALEDGALLLRRPASERVALRRIEREVLSLALNRDRKVGHEFGQRPGVVARPGSVSDPHARRITCNQNVAAEPLTRKEQAAGQAERRIEIAFERRLEPLDVDAEFLKQGLGRWAVERIGRLERLAAAVADDAALADRELVALGMAAEVVVIVEDQDARLRVLAAIEPGGREPAQAATNHDEVVAFFDRQIAEIEPPALAGERMRHLERAVVLAAQAGERGRIAGGLRCKLCRGREAGGNGQRHTVEKIAPRDRHGRNLSRRKGQERS